LSHRDLEKRCELDLSRIAKSLDEARDTGGWSSYDEEWLSSGSHFTQGCIAAPTHCHGSFHSLLRLLVTAHIRDRAQNFHHATVTCTRTCICYSVAGLQLHWPTHCMQSTAVELR
jgi:hypothetical protein